MGSTKQKTTSESSQTTTPQATAEETELNRLYLNREKTLDPQITQVQQQGLDLASRLLGGQSLPGYLNTLPGGISGDVTNSIVNQSLKDLNTQLAASGAGTFLESGASQSIGARTAADIRNQAEQFNLQNLLQLLNLGLGGQAQVQAPIQGFSAQLSNRLQGLRPVTQVGTGTTSGKTSYDFFTSPFTSAWLNAAGQAASGAGSCWIASELFGGWAQAETICARFYVSNIGPKWFKQIYERFGARFAQLLRVHGWMKSLIKPLFTYFAKEGRYALAK